MFVVGGLVLKFEVVKYKKMVSIDVDKYEVFLDCEVGNRGVELEFDFILMVDLEKSCKFICG